MIYELVYSIKECGRRIRHFFRAFVCKDFYYESHGLAECKRANGCSCEWYLCPKRKGGEDE